MGLNLKKKLKRGIKSVGKLALGSSALGLGGVPLIAGAKKLKDSGFFKGKKAGSILSSPFDVSSGIGSASFDPDTGQITSELSPELQALQSGQIGQAGTFLGNVEGAGQLGQQQSQDAFGLSSLFSGDVSGAGAGSQALGQDLFSQAGQFQAGVPGAGQGALTAGRGFIDSASQFDPFQAAEDQFSRLDAILEPGRTQARTGTAAGLLSSGRLGSTAGARTQGAVEGEIEKQRQMLLSDQLEGAQRVQQGQVGMGTTLSQLGLAEQGQQSDLANMLFGQGVQASGLGLQEQGQTADIANIFSGMGINTGTFGLQQQMGQQGLGTQSLQNALGIDSQMQALMGLGSNISKPIGTTPAQKSSFENLAGGFLSGGGGAALLSMI